MKPVRLFLKAAFAAAQFHLSPLSGGLKMQSSTLIPLSWPHFTNQSMSLLEGLLLP